MHGKDTESPPQGPLPERASLRQVIAGVLAAFFGVRKRQKHEEGISKASPGQIILVGILLVALFVGTLVLIVNLILRAVE